MAVAACGQSAFQEYECNHAKEDGRLEGKWIYKWSLPCVDSYIVSQAKLRDSFENEVCPYIMITEKLFKT